MSFKNIWQTQQAMYKIIMWCEAIYVYMVDMSYFFHIHTIFDIFWIFQ